MSPTRKVQYTAIDCIRCSRVGYPLHLSYFHLASKQSKTPSADSRSTNITSSPSIHICVFSFQYKAVLSTCRQHIPLAISLSASDSCNPNSTRREASTFAMMRQGLRNMRTGQSWAIRKRSCLAWKHRTRSPRSWTWILKRIVTMYAVALRQSPRLDRVFDPRCVLRTHAVGQIINAP